MTRPDGIVETVQSGNQLQPIDGGKLFETLPTAVFGLIVGLTNLEEAAALALSCKSLASKMNHLMTSSPVRPRMYSKDVYLTHDQIRRIEAFLKEHRTLDKTVTAASPTKAAGIKTGLEPLICRLKVYGRFLSGTSIVDGLMKRTVGTNWLDRELVLVRSLVKNIWKRCVLTVAEEDFKGRGFNLRQHSDKWSTAAQNHLITSTWWTTTDGHTALHLFARTGDWDGLDYFLGQGPNCKLDLWLENAEGHTVLTYTLTRALGSSDWTVRRFATQLAQKLIEQAPKGGRSLDRALALCWRLELYTEAWTLLRLGANPCQLFDDLPDTTGSFCVLPSMLRYLSSENPENAAQKKHLLAIHLATLFSQPRHPAAKALCRRSDLCDYLQLMKDDVLLYDPFTDKKVHKEQLTLYSLLTAQDDSHAPLKWMLSEYQQRVEKQALGAELSLPQQLALVDSGFRNFHELTGKLLGRFGSSSELIEQLLSVISEASTQFVRILLETVISLTNSDLKRLFEATLVNGAQAPAQTLWKSLSQSDRANLCENRAILEACTRLGIPVPIYADKQLDALWPHALFSESSCNELRARPKPEVEHFSEFLSLLDKHLVKGLDVDERILAAAELCGVDLSDPKQLIKLSSWGFLNTRLFLKAFLAYKRAPKQHHNTFYTAEAARTYVTPLIRRGQAQTLEILITHAPNNFFFGCDTVQERLALLDALTTASIKNAEFGKVLMQLTTHWQAVDIKREQEQPYYLRYVALGGCDPHCLTHLIRRALKAEPDQKTALRHLAELYRFLVDQSQADPNLVSQLIYVVDQVKPSKVAVSHGTYERLLTQTIATCDFSQLLQIMFRDNDTTGLLGPHLMQHLQQGEPDNIQRILETLVRQAQEPVPKSERGL